MTELWFDAEASETLDRLARDPSRGRLLAAVDRVLDQLEANPADPSVRRRLFTNPEPQLWCVHVSTDDDWVVLWSPHPQSEDAVVVQYIGPASFG